MGSTIQFPAASAELNAEPVVIYSPHKSYRLTRPCTIRAAENGKWVVLEYDQAYQQYLPVYFFDRRAQANLAMYRLVNASDDLMVVDTCQACWKEIRIGDQRTYRGELLYCSRECESHRDVNGATLALRIAVICSAALLISGGWGAALWAFARLIAHYFGVR